MDDLLLALLAAVAGLDWSILGRPFIFILAIFCSKGIVCDRCGGLLAGHAGNGLSNPILMSSEGIRTGWSQQPVMKRILYDTHSASGAEITVVHSEDRDLDHLDRSVDHNQGLEGLEGD